MTGRGNPFHKITGSIQFFPVISLLMVGCTKPAFVAFKKKRVDYTAGTGGGDCGGSGADGSDGYSPWSYTSEKYPPVRHEPGLRDEPDFPL